MRGLAKSVPLFTHFNDPMMLNGRVAENALLFAGSSDPVPDCCTIVKPSLTNAPRYLDGLIVLGEPTAIAESRTFDIAGLQLTCDRLSLVDPAHSAIPRNLYG